MYIFDNKLLQYCELSYNFFFMICIVLDQYNNRMLVNFLLIYEYSWGFYSKVQDILQYMYLFLAYKIVNYGN